MVPTGEARVPQGIRSLTEQFGAHLRPCVDGVRVMALGLLFLLLSAATLGPAAMAATATTGIVPAALHMQDGGETPPSQDATTSLSATRSSQRLHLPASNAAICSAKASVSPRLRLARRLHLAVAPPRPGVPRRQHRGRAPPR